MLRPLNRPGRARTVALLFALLLEVVGEAQRQGRAGALREPGAGAARRQEVEVADDGWRQRPLVEY